MDGPCMCIWMVQIHCVKVSIWMAKFCPNGRYVFVYLDVSKSTVQGLPNGRSPNGRFRDVQGDINPNWRWITVDLDERPHKRPYTVSLDVHITPFGLLSLYDAPAAVWCECKATVLRFPQPLHAADPSMVSVWSHCDIFKTRTYRPLRGPTSWLSTVCTRALQSTLFQKPGGVAWAGQRITQVLVSNIGCQQDSRNHWVSVCQLNIGCCQSF